MRVFVLIAVACFALAVTSSALATGASATAAPAPSQYQDPASDAGTGPDITNITVSNDNGGTLTFRIDIGNRPTLTPLFFLNVYVNSDANQATGDAQFGGVEYILQYLAGQTTLFHWNGSAWDSGSHPVSLIGSFANGLTLSIDAADLGGIARLSFWVQTWDNFDDPNNYDDAPLFDQFYYTIVILPSIVSIVPPSALLKTVKPGKTLAVRGFKLRLDNNDVVGPDSVTCVLKIAGKVLPPTGPCKWKIPVTAAGKRLVLIVTLTYGDESIKKTYPGKVKT